MLFLQIELRRYEMPFSFLTHLNFSTLSCISSVFTGVIDRYTSIILAISKCWTGKYINA